MTTTTPRPIAFADIREGDTIRATKSGSEHVVVESRVSRYDGALAIGQEGWRTTLRSYVARGYEFTLLDRPAEPLVPGVYRDRDGDLLLRDAAGAFHLLTRWGSSKGSNLPYPFWNAETGDRKANELAYVLVQAVNP
ncbi:hypothetical protein [Microbacterium sp.]|uniref:hypothetical protein n=1 Tax=Microbacterium sp. TaxID=51671 RepID=UPI003242F3B8